MSLYPHHVRSYRCLMIAREEHFFAQHPGRPGSSGRVRAQPCSDHAQRGRAAGSHVAQNVPDKKDLLLPVPLVSYGAERGVLWSGKHTPLPLITSRMQMQIVTQVNLEISSWTPLLI